MKARKKKKGSGEETTAFMGNKSTAMTMGDLHGLGRRRVSL